jgi:hypothetical protein
MTTRPPFSKITLHPYHLTEGQVAEGLHVQIIKRIGVPVVCYPGGMVNGWLTCNAVTFAVTPLGLWRVSEDADTARLANAYNVLCAQPLRIGRQETEIAGAIYLAAVPSQKSNVPASSPSPSSPQRSGDREEEEDITANRAVVSM